MSAPLTSPAPRRKRPLRAGAMTAVMALTLGFSAAAVVPAFADDPVNLPPVAVDDYFSTLQDTIVSGSVCGNDSDPELADLDAVGWSTPSSGTLLSYNGSACTFEYQPAAGFTGIATFTYFAHDHVQSSVALATVTIEVAPVAPPAPANSAPVAADDQYSTPMGQTLTVSTSILANDSDADGDVLSLNWYSMPPTGLLAVDSSTGTFTYQPAPGYAGPIVFTYDISDGSAMSNEATVTITVVDDPAANHAPVAQGESYAIGAGQKLIVPAPGPTANDSDPDGDSLDVLIGGPQGGTLPGEQLSFAPGNSFTYQTPSGGWTGTRVWDYYVWDGEYYSNQVQLTIEVTADQVEQATPVAVDDEYTVEQGDTLTIAAPGPFANDSDADSTFTLAGYTAPLHGDLIFDPVTGAFEYAPDAGYLGDESIEYTLIDANGNKSAPATILIHIVEPAEPVNSAPVANDDDYSVAYGETLVLPSGSGVLANDTDADGDTLEVVAATDPASGQLTIGFAGQVTWVPEAGFSGTTTFTYRAGDGILQSDDATVTITVGQPGANLAPTAVADAYTVPQGGTLSVSSLFGLLVNDLDPENDSLTVAGTTGPTVGTLSVGAFGGFVFTPPADFWGTATFQYGVTDGTNDSEWATVTITVSPAETGHEPEQPTGDPAPEQPGTPGAPDGGVDLSNTGSGAPGSALASTGSSVSALGAFSALLLVAIGGVVLRHGRVRSRTR